MPDSSVIFCASLVHDVSKGGDYSAGELASSAIEMQFVHGSIPILKYTVRRGGQMGTITAYVPSEHG